MVKFGLTNEDILFKYNFICCRYQYNGQKLSYDNLTINNKIKYGKF